MESLDIIINVKGIEKKPSGADRYSVSITGNNYYCVALDEANEMEINLKTKQAINSYSSAYLDSLTHYLPNRAETLHNFTNQLCIENTDSQHRDTNKQYTETEELTIEQATTSLFKDNSESQKKKMKQQKISLTAVWNHRLANVHHMFSNKSAGFIR
ncbi:unnamed protein product [Mytilus edulis]|uniref:Uncharacterized protein n=1 Tax=Mytilus edulis TaxID=6550 RepID=A0A8S3PSN7_MYTED|nr:unnamed protein product [Mytilus edulis]